MSAKSTDTITAQSTLPILYSLQNCPYAIRARLAILLAQQTVQIRAITMKNKPDEMVQVSPKATVPVLVLGDEALADSEAPYTVIDESLDIMLWALNLNDPENALYSHDPAALTDMLRIIQRNDDEFKPNLERYKRAKRFHGDNLEDCRLACEPFVQDLERRLSKHDFFMGDTPSLLDYALLPFIRQFSRVNKPVFNQPQYANLHRWLSHQLQSRLFQRSMVLYPLWLDEREVCLFA